MRHGECLMTATIAEITELLLQTRALKTGSFKLKDGSYSPFYLDLRVIPSYPSYFEKTVKWLSNSLQGLNIDAIAGIMSAGIPFATGISLELGIPLIQVRKTPKDYGLSKLLEGEWEQGWKVAVVDDLITSGSSKETAIEALREAKLNPIRIQVLIDRTGKKSLPLVRGVPVNALARIQEILAYGLKNELFNENERKLLEGILEKMDP